MAKIHPDAIAFDGRLWELSDLAFRIFVVALSQTRDDGTVCARPYRLAGIALCDTSRTGEVEAAVDELISAALFERTQDDRVRVNAWQPPTDPRDRHIKRTSCVVYFVQAGGDGGPVKIGIARDLGSRLNSLRTGCPDPIVVLATAPGGKNEEAALHERFATHRRRGEWFAAAPELLAYVDSVAASGRL